MVLALSPPEKWGTSPLPGFHTQLYPLRPFSWKEPASMVNCQCAGPTDAPTQKRRHSPTSCRVPGDSEAGTVLGKKASLTQARAP